MIVEMAGRPAKYVKESLEKHVMVLNDFKDLRVHSIKVSDGREVENSGGLFTCFAEVDFESDNFSRLSETMFDFMPSSVEVIEPPTLTLESTEATDLLNNISGRLHRYDEVARMAQVKVNDLVEKVNLAKKFLKEKGIIKKGKLLSPNKSKKKKGSKKSIKKKVVKKTSKSKKK